MALEQCTDCEWEDGWEDGYDEGYKEAVRWCIEGLEVISESLAAGGWALDGVLPKSGRHPMHEELVKYKFIQQGALLLAAKRIKDKCPYDLTEEEDGDEG